MVAPDLMRAAVTADYSSECLEFLRSCFDIEDPDPSMVQTWVSKFKKRMKTLFIDGQILGDSSALPARESEKGTHVKTTSQMVFDEISSPEPRLGISYEGKTGGVGSPGRAALRHSNLVALPFSIIFLDHAKRLRIYYGDRVHYLCTKATSAEVRKVMNEMAQVVGAMLQRLEVDLAQDEVAVALQAFNLAAWEGSNSHDALRLQLRKLCLVLQLDPKDVVPSFVAHAKVLATIRRTAVAKKYCVDNRVLWSWALCPVWKAKHASNVALTPSCDFLVRFFLSLKINTTTLERDLGLLLAHLEAHSGPLQASGGTAASILEISMEGPQSEAEFFYRSSEQGPLQPTEFGSLCAKLWLQHFGRRFRYSYKKTNDPNSKSKVQSPKSKVAAKGSFASVVQGRSVAASKLAEASEHPASFVPGLTLPLPPPKPTSFEGTRWSSGTSSCLSLKGFQKHTLRKKNRVLVAVAICSVAFAMFLNLSYYSKIKTASHGLVALEAIPRELKIASMDGQPTLQPNLYLEDCVRRLLWLSLSFWACMLLIDQWNLCLHTSDTPICKLWPQHLVSLCCLLFNAPMPMSLLWRMWQT